MPDSSTLAAIPVIDSIAAVAGRYDAFVIDLWGVLHDGAKAYPGAVEALRRLKGLGKRIGLLSNAPRRTAFVAAHAARLGVTPELYDRLLTSGEDAWRHLDERRDPWYAALGRRAYPIMSRERDGSFLDGLDLELVADPDAADFILATGVNGPRDRVEDFAPVLDRAAARGLPLVCVNPDLEVVRLNGEREICAGMIALAYEARGGLVRYHGKPHRPVYDTLLAQLGVGDGKRVLGIGDSLRTDVAGAAAAGFDALLVTGGIHAEELGGAAGMAPDPGHLAAVCARAGQRPVAAIPAFVW
ncbi:MAG: TIGR01459 family HAD-type hydrolase [Rhodospirillaceae bacterium]|nr:TIGR01459 family HAD-type hydrolase [Rhodospirillaceae bacterium]